VPRPRPGAESRDHAIPQVAESPALAGPIGWPVPGVAATTGRRYAY